MVPRAARLVPPSQARVAHPVPRNLERVALLDLPSQARAARLTPPRQARAAPPGQVRVVHPILPGKRQPAATLARVAIHRRVTVTTTTLIPIPVTTTFTTVSHCQVLL